MDIEIHRHFYSGYWLHRNHQYYQMLQSTILAQFDTGGGNYGMMGNTVDGTVFSAGILVAMIVTFTVKIKLFGVVTSYITGMFQ